MGKSYITFRSVMTGITKDLKLKIGKLDSQIKQSEKQDVMFEKRYHEQELVKMKEELYLLQALQKFIRRFGKNDNGNGTCNCNTQRWFDERNTDNGKQPF